MTLTLTLPKTLLESTCVPNPYANFGLDRRSRLAGYRQQTDKQTDKHIAFYYVDTLYNSR